MSVEQALIPERTARGGFALTYEELRRHLPRAARVALAAVAAVYLLYVLAVNVILGTGLLRSWLNSKPDELHVSYGSAWSPYPGRVFVRDLTLRFQDDNVQMLLELERARFTVDLLELTQQTFHVRGIDGENASFRVRHKLSTAEGQEGRLAAYPPIAGFPDPPVREPRPSQAIPDARYDLWTVHLEDVSTSIRELWVMEYRYRGAGSVTGGMRLRPIRELWVSPSVLLTHGGELAMGDQPLLAGSDARLEVRVDPFDVRVARGAAVLRQVTAHADLHGELLSLAPLSSAYFRDMPVTLEGGRGRIDVLARVERGLVHPDTRIDWRSSDVTVRSPELSVSGDLALAGRVDPGKKGSSAALVDPNARPSLVAELSSSRLRAQRSKRTVAIAADARATIATANVDLTGDFPLSAASTEVPSARFPDLPALGPLVLPDDVEIAKGSASAAFRGAYRGGALDARADVSLDGARVVTKKVGFTAHGNVRALASSRDVRSGISLDGSSVDLHDVALRIADSRTEGLRVAVDVTDGLVRPQKGSVDATLGVAVAPGDRVLRLAASLASLPKAVGEAPAGPEAHARLRMHAGRSVDVRVLEARNGALVVHGRVKKPPAEPASGALLLEVGVLRAGLEIAGGETQVRPFASRDWLERQTQ